MTITIHSLVRALAAACPWQTINQRNFRVSTWPFVILGGHRARACCLSSEPPFDEACLGQSWGTYVKSVPRRDREKFGLITGLGPNQSRQSIYSWTVLLAPVGNPFQCWVIGTGMVDCCFRD